MSNPIVIAHHRENAVGGGHFFQTLKHRRDHPGIAPHVVPGEGDQTAFWIITGVMVAMLVGMVAFFRRRGWL